MKSGMQNSVMSEKNVQLMCYLALSGEREELTSCFGMTEQYVLMENLRHG